jgi:hypothetical protein
VSYPDLEAGIFLSRKLVFSLHERLTKNEAAPSHSFNIDPSYEFAKFLRTGCGLRSYGTLYAKANTVNF